MLYSGGGTMPVTTLKVVNLTEKAKGVSLRELRWKVKKQGQRREESGRWKVFKIRESKVHFY